MQNINSLLKSVAPDPVDPERAVVDADLARGRAALATAHRRRTYRRISVGGVALAAAGVATVIIATSAPSRAGSTTSRPSRGTPHAQVLPHVRVTTPAKARSHHKPAHAGGSRIELVAYTGAQLPGFTVKQVPDGWHLSSSTPFALLITPDGSSDNNPDVFVNKLAVLTSLTDEHGLGSGDPVTINGQDGRVSHQPGVLMLNYNSPSGFGVNIQAPDALHWSDAQIVAFAQGVTVTSNAVHSHG